MENILKKPGKRRKGIYDRKNYREFYKKKSLRIGLIWHGTELNVFCEREHWTVGSRTGGTNLLA
jgi:hypothetical protein